MINAAARIAEKAAVIRVLLVEDNPGDARLIDLLLSERPGFATTCADSLGNALRIFETDRPDAILLDLGLPDSQGLETLRAVRLAAPELPVVVFTGLDDEETALKAVHEGCQDYLVKGEGDGAFIAKTIQFAIERKKTETALRESEDRYRGLVELSPDAIIVESGGKVVFANRAALRMFGTFRTRNLVGRPLTDLVHPEFQKAVGDRMRSLREVGTEPGYAEERILRLDGEEIDVEVGGTPIAFRGRPAMQFVFRDITERKRASDLLRESESRYRSLAENMPDTVAELDLDGIVLLANRGLPGQAPEGMIGANLFDLVPADYGNTLGSALEQARTTGRTAYFEATLPAPEGTTWWSNRVVAIREGPAVARYLFIASDVSQRRSAEEQLNKLIQALEQSPASVIITDTSGYIEYVNSRFVEVTGYSRIDVLGQKPSLLKSGSTPDETYQALWKAVASGREWRGELLNRRKDGSLFWEYASISPIRNSEGRITHYLAIKEDISVRKAYEEQLLHQANFDELTDLPNRLLALDRLSQAVAGAHRESKAVALLFIDLDNLKKVNDTLGHASGDRILAEVAERLTATVREGDTVARLGGDEFLIILPDLSAIVFAEVMAKRILDACAHPFDVADTEVFVTARIGISVYPGDGDDSQVLLRNAHAAMYRAKEMGGNTYRFFTSEMNERAVARLETESRLRHALERQELSLVYQPLVDTGDGLPIGVEALLRWNNPDLGIVPPDRFIPLAEETGLIVEIGRWVLETACHTVAGWRTADGRQAKVAVNVSSRQFKGISLSGIVADALSASGLPPECLEVELTERLLIEDDPETTVILNALNEMGVRLSIDDFGTGYSALSYLKRFPFDVLKIDRSFLMGVPGNPEDSALVSAMIVMAHGLGLRVIGEGVETPEQFAFLRAHHCDIAQGFLFARPLPPAEAEAFLAGSADEVQELPSIGKAIGRAC